MDSNYTIQDTTLAPLCPCSHSNDQRALHFFFLVQRQKVKTGKLSEQEPFQSAESGRLWPLSAPQLERESVLSGYLRVCSFLKDVLPWSCSQYVVLGRLEDQFRKKQKWMTQKQWVFQCTEWKRSSAYLCNFWSKYLIKHYMKLHFQTPHQGHFHLFHWQIRFSLFGYKKKTPYIHFYSTYFFVSCAYYCALSTHPVNICERGLICFLTEWMICQLFWWSVKSLFIFQIKMSNICQFQFHKCGDF